MTQSKQRSSAPLKIALMLIVPVMLLTACAGNSPTCPPVLQPLPAPPSMSTQQPQESYSARASQNIEQWQQRLMGTQLMQP